MKLNEIEALARDGETDAASVLALIACIRMADLMLKYDGTFNSRDEYRSARSKLEQSP